MIGVAVVKSSLHEVERRWLGQEAPALIVDANGDLFGMPYLVIIMLVCFALTHWLMRYTLT